MKYLLTKRQLEIRYLFVECAMTAKQIAYELTIAVDTVNNHLKRIRALMGAVSGMDLANKYYNENYHLIKKDEPTPAPVLMVVHRKAKVVCVDFNSKIRKAA